ncbi:hypothetical protein PIB30_080466 [Stylosanthes scabra]|uniref:Uncharacterized protein n=1 Tax=Stylosanthes scabra TaxID=79078 RepID=A0ABU6QRP8_9FABA|nr:hypothetical protein [Stylosanthes scabra]
MKHVYDNIWRGLVPPRVEILVCHDRRIEHQRILAKKRNLKMGEDTCVLCHGEIEMDKEFKAKGQWEELAINNMQRWTHWI